MSQLLVICIVSSCVILDKKSYFVACIYWWANTLFFKDYILESTFILSYFKSERYFAELYRHNASIYGCVRCAHITWDRSQHVSGTARRRPL